MWLVVPTDARRGRREAVRGEPGRGRPLQVDGAAGRAQAGAEHHEGVGRHAAGQPQEDQGRREGLRLGGGEIPTNQ